MLQPQALLFPRCLQRLGMSAFILMCYRINGHYKTHLETSLSKHWWHCWATARGNVNINIPTSLFKRLKGNSALYCWDFERVRLTDLDLEPTSKFKQIPFTIWSSVSHQWCLDRDCKLVFSTLCLSLPQHPPQPGGGKPETELLTFHSLSFQDGVKCGLRTLGGTTLTM